VQVESGGQVSLRSNPDCFERRSLDKLVSFTTSASCIVPAAPLVAVLAAASPASIRFLTVAHSEHRIRAGPHGPTSSRAKLMVYLT
jgi:hypothetical protein